MSVGRSRPRRTFCELATDSAFAAKYGDKAAIPAVQAVRTLMTLVNENYQYLREISDFQFDRHIGKGGFGEVWLGNDLRTGKVGRPRSSSRSSFPVGRLRSSSGKSRRWRV
jgi:hypothetical protein